MACCCGAPGSVHEGCGAEWKRNVGMCVMCAVVPAPPDEHKYWRAGCDAKFNPPFIGHSPLGE